MKRPVSRAVPRFLLLAAMPAILAACSAADNEPSSMPTGYKYTNVQQYRVPVTGAERNMQYPGMNAGGDPSRMQPSAGEMATPMGAPPMQGVTSSTTMTSTTQTSQGAAMPLMKADAPAPMAVAPPASDQPMPPSPAMAPAPMMAPAIAPQAAATPAPAMPAAGGQWQGAADDLLGKAEVRFGRLRDPVYVRDASVSQPGEIEFRAALLYAMARHHYKLAPAADKAPFTFDYSLSGQPAGEETITLKTLAEGREASRVSGMYNMGMGGSMAMAPAAPPMMAPPAPPMASAQPPMPAQNGPMQPVPWGSSDAATAPASQTASAAPMYQAQPQMQAEPSAAPPVPSHAPASAAASDDAGGPGALPPAGSAGTPTAGADSDQTYVYDGRSMNAPGKTAYEQIHGTDHTVDAAGDDGAADH